MLTNRASIGINSEPRHLDFHPSRPWIFVTLERQKNKLLAYAKLDGDTVSPEPLFIKDTLADPGNVRAGQMPGTIHVHPNGRFVYVANRASSTTAFEGKPISIGGENAIAVYSIDQGTGEPTLIQNIDMRGFEPRTFAIDPRGQILVAGNQMSLSVRKGQSVIRVPPSLAVYRVSRDGTLDFARKYDIEAGDSGSLFWMGLVALP